MALSQFPPRVTILLVYDKCFVIAFITLVLYTVRIHLLFPHARDTLNCGKSRSIVTSELHEFWSDCTDWGRISKNSYLYLIWTITWKWTKSKLEKISFNLTWVVHTKNIRSHMVKKIRFGSLWRAVWTQPKATSLKTLKSQRNSFLYRTGIHQSGSSVTSTNQLQSHTDCGRMDGVADVCLSMAWSDVWGGGGEIQPTNQVVMADCYSFSTSRKRNRVSDGELHVSK